MDDKTRELFYLRLSGLASGCAAASLSGASPSPTRSPGRQLLPTLPAHPTNKAEGGCSSARSDPPGSPTLPPFSAGKHVTRATGLLFSPDSGLLTTRCNFSVGKMVVLSKKASALLWLCQRTGPAYTCKRDGKRFCFFFTIKVKKKKKKKDHEAFLFFFLETWGLYPQISESCFRPCLHAIVFVSSPIHRFLQVARNHNTVTYISASSIRTQE